MKLVTFDDGLIGRIAAENVMKLDAPSMREYFERGRQAGDVCETGRVPRLADELLSTIGGLGTKRHTFHPAVHPTALGACHERA